MSCMSQNFRLVHVSNSSVRNFRISLLMYPGSLSPRLTLTNVPSLLLRRTATGSLRGTMRGNCRSVSHRTCCFGLRSGAVAGRGPLLPVTAEGGVQISPVHVNGACTGARAAGAGLLGRSRAAITATPGACRPSPNYTGTAVRPRPPNLHTPLRSAGHPVYSECSCCCL